MSEVYITTLIAHTPHVNFHLFPAQYSIRTMCPVFALCLALYVCIWALYVPHCCVWQNIRLRSIKYTPVKLQNVQSGELTCIVSACPEMDWHHIQGVPCPMPHSSWDRLQLHSVHGDPEPQLWIMDILDSVYIIDYQIHKMIDAQISAMKTNTVPHFQKSIYYSFSC